jgi:hypothetical protein
MEKRIVEGQPSLVIAYCIQSGKLLTAVYDSGYRKGKGPYPLTSNIIGGNPERGLVQKCPKDVLVREIKEEYDPLFQREHPLTNQFGQKVAWANPEDIALIQKELLQDLTPFQDFYVESTSFGEGTASYQGIYSYFFSDISAEAIKVAESNLRRQKCLTPEGLTGVFTLEELESDSRGQFSTAHITAPVLNYRFGTNIPFPSEFLRVSPIGKPRDSYRDYLEEFEYSTKRTPNHNDPTKMDPSFYQVIFGEE